jgi:threonine/homoserine/homoserine lactone efflux protein
MHDPVLFSLTVLAILATPGPTNTLLATSAALAGIRRSLPLIAAELAGYLTAISILHFLLAELLAQHGWIAMGLRLLVGAYLLFTAWDLWNRRDPFVAAAAPHGIRFERVFVTTLLNPKAIVFAFGVIPLSSPDAAAYLAAFSVFVVIAASSWIALGRFAAAIVSPATSRAIPRVSAAVLTCFAGLIAFGG